MSHLKTSLKILDIKTLDMPRFALRSWKTIYQNFLFSKSFGQYQKAENNNAEWQQSCLALVNIKHI